MSWQESNRMYDMSLANVEALAQDEGWEECRTFTSTSYTYVDCGGNGYGGNLSTVTYTFTCKGSVYSGGNCKMGTETWIYDAPCDDYFYVSYHVVYSFYETYCYHLL